MGFYYREDLDDLTPEQLSRALGEPHFPTCRHGIDVCPLCDCPRCQDGDDPENHDH